MAKGNLAAMKRALAKVKRVQPEDEQPGQPEQEPDEDDMTTRPTPPRFGR